MLVWILFKHYLYKINKKYGFNLSIWVNMYSIGSRNRGPWPLLNLKTLHKNVIFTTEIHFSLAKWPPYFSSFLLQWCTAKSSRYKLAFTSDITFINPCCSGLSILYALRCDVLYDDMCYTAITMMCSNVSHGMNVREIGLKLARWPVQAPFLKIGTTRAFFQSAGALHCFRVLGLIYCISVSIGAILLDY